MNNCIERIKELEKKVAALELLLQEQPKDNSDERKDFPRMRTSPDEPLSDKVVPHFSEFFLHDED